MKVISEKEFKSKNKGDKCSHCSLRIPCALSDSICDLITPCSICQIRDTCSSLCLEMRGYLNRGLKRQPDTLPLTDAVQSAIMILEPKGEFKFSVKDIPWNCISSRDRLIIEEHFLQGRSIREISQKLNLHPDTVYKKIKGNRKRKGILQRLKEFAFYNNLIKSFGSYLPSQFGDILNEYYIKCNKLQTIAINKGQSIGKTHALLVQARKLINKFNET